ncbi:MAG: N-methyl-L-tryptophan oxidase, partial [Candidatus Eremiobacteraeota bacterium]|nr:N-methyl-L-tryptophan oxidase [Candidatus Eremiobacteraeota bacterium]
VIVLGLGGLGSAAAYWLAKRGARVVGLEQFELGHARGASHDHSRIIRYSYFSPVYVRLAKHAYAAWETLERDAGEKVVYKTGGLDIRPRDGAIPLEPYAKAMRECSVPFESLDAAEIRRRWPAWQIDDDIHGLFQPDGGLVAAMKATAEHQRMAREHGATLLERTPVTAIATDGNEVTVATESATLRAGSLVVAAGPWSAYALEQLGLRIPLEVTKEQVLYFRAPDLAGFALGNFPIWIWMDDPAFYGFPVFGEADAVKVTQDAGGQPVDANTRGFEEDPEITARVRAFLERYLPAALGPLSLVKTCLYTLPPDRDFVIDTLPGHSNVAVAIGAGHAFKFAGVIGRILADLAVRGDSPILAETAGTFDADRPILTMESPPKTYMV